MWQPIWQSDLKICTRLNNVGNSVCGRQALLVNFLFVKYKKGEKKNDLNNGY